MIAAMTLVAALTVLMLISAGLTVASFTLLRWLGNDGYGHGHLVDDRSTSDWAPPGLPSHPHSVR
jgi:hypothetical protein